MYSLLILRSNGETIYKFNLSFNSSNTTGMCIIRTMVEYFEDFIFNKDVFPPTIQQNKQQSLYYSFESALGLNSIYKYKLTPDIRV